MQVYKATWCAFFTKGKCSRGQNCSFAHSAEELRERPNLARTKLCAAYMSCKNPNCNFAHDVDQLRNFPGKKGLCRLHREGKCSRGAACKYAHSVEELNHLPRVKENKFQEYEDFDKYMRLVSNSVPDIHGLKGTAVLVPHTALVTSGDSGFQLSPSPGSSLIRGSGFNQYQDFGVPSPMNYDESNAHSSGPEELEASRPVEFDLSRPLQITNDAEEFQNGGPANSVQKNEKNHDEKEAHDLQHPSIETVTTNYICTDSEQTKLKTNYESTNAERRVATPAKYVAAMNSLDDAVHCASDATLNNAYLYKAFPPRKDGNTKAATSTLLPSSGPHIVECFSKNKSAISIIDEDTKQNAKYKPTATGQVVGFEPVGERQSGARSQNTQHNRKMLLLDPNGHFMDEMCSRTNSLNSEYRNRQNDSAYRSCMEESREASAQTVRIQFSDGIEAVQRRKAPQLHEAQYGPPFWSNRTAYNRNSSFKFEPKHEHGINLEQEPESFHRGNFGCYDTYRRQNVVGGSGCGFLSASCVGKKQPRPDYNNNKTQYLNEPSIAVANEKLNQSNHIHEDREYFFSRDNLIGQVGLSFSEFIPRKNKLCGPGYPSIYEKQEFHPHINSNHLHSSLLPERCSDLLTAYHHRHQNARYKHPAQNSNNSHTKFDRNVSGLHYYENMCSPCSRIVSKQYDELISRQYETFYKDILAHKKSKPEGEDCRCGAPADRAALPEASGGTRPPVVDNAGNQKII